MAQRGEMSCPRSCGGAVTQMISNNSRFYKRFKEMVLDSLPHAAAEENNTVPAATGEFLVSVSGQVLKQKLALVQLGVEERGN